MTILVETEAGPVVKGAEPNKIVLRDIVSRVIVSNSLVVQRVSTCVVFFMFHTLILVKKILSPYGFTNRMISCIQAVNKS